MLFPLLFAASLAHAATIEISRCPTVITQPGDYVVSQNLVCPQWDQTAITIQNTRMVNLNLGGKTIQGTPHLGWGGPAAIVVKNSSNVNINGTMARIVDFTSGISADTVSSLTIAAGIQRALFLDASGLNLQVFHGSNVLLSNIAMPHLRGNGFYLADNTGVTVSHVTMAGVANGQSKTAFLLSRLSNSKIDDVNMLNVNQPFQISEGAGTTISNVKMTGNAYYGISIDLTKTYTFQNVALDKTAVPVAVGMGGNPGLKFENVTWGTPQNPDKIICHLGTNVTVPPVTFVNTAAPKAPYPSCQ